MLCTQSNFLSDEFDTGRNQTLECGVGNGSIQHHNIQFFFSQQTEKADKYRYTANVQVHISKEPLKNDTHKAAEFVKKKSFGRS